jgi:hypothetical protein
MHGSWPFTQTAPYFPGKIAVTTPGAFPEPVSETAETLHEQALQMDQIAYRKESAAMDLRTAATAHDMPEKEKLRKVDEAAKLEEEAEKCRLEAERLRSEALHLDGELARGLVEERDGGQVSGIIQH